MDFTSLFRLTAFASAYGIDAAVAASAAQALDVTADARFQPLAMAGIPLGCTRSESSSANGPASRPGA